MAQRLRRDWTDARLKVDTEGQCRNCGRTDRRLEAAHIVDRQRADTVEVAPRVLWVNPDDIVPLCGPVGDSATCHCRYDRHELDLLPVLRVHEQARAVEVAGGLAAAFRRVTGGRLEPLPSAVEEFPWDVPPLDHRGQIAGQTELGDVP